DKYPHFPQHEKFSLLYTQNSGAPWQTIPGVVPNQNGDLDPNIRDAIKREKFGLIIMHGWSTGHDKGVAHNNARSRIIALAFREHDEDDRMTYAKLIETFQYINSQGQVIERFLVIEEQALDSMLAFHGFCCFSCQTLCCILHMWDAVLEVGEKKYTTAGFLFLVDWDNTVAQENLLKFMADASFT
ncbi:hypothetical protein ACJX0J_014424, partial [Zea mays]